MEKNLEHQKQVLEMIKNGQLNGIQDPLSKGEPLINWAIRNSAELANTLIDKYPSIITHASSVWPEPLALASFFK
jgi:hypothetical protein